MSSLKSIVVSYSVEDQAFRHESLNEYVQGNALRILTNHHINYCAVAIVETTADARAAIANFSRLQRVARGDEAPSLSMLRSNSVADTFALKPANRLLRRDAGDVGN